MKKYVASIILLITVFSSIAQNNNPNSILVRHDTTILKASECEWIIKSLIKNDPSLTTEIGKTVSLVMLQTIQKGKLKAIDRETNKPIPAKEIFTWRMPVDTLPQYDDRGNVTKYVGVKSIRSSENINQVRVFQDWYFDISTGKIQSVIKWIELMEEIHTSSTGMFIGYATLCRIYY